MSISKKKKYVKLNKRYGRKLEVKFYQNPEQPLMNYKPTYAETMRSVIQYIMSLPLRDQLVVSQIMQLD